MRPRRVYIVSASQKIHQIMRAAFQPPGYVCELLTDFKTLAEEGLQSPDVIVIDLTDFRREQIIDSSRNYLKKQAGTLAVFINNGPDHDLLKTIPEKNMFDLLISPVSLDQAIALVNRVNMIFSLRERIKTELQEKNSIIKNLPLPILIISEDLTVTFANRASKKVFGIPETTNTSEIPIERIVESISRDDRKEFAEALRRAFCAGLKSALKVELELNGASSGILPLKIFPVTDDVDLQEKTKVFIVADYGEIFTADEAEILQKEKLVVLGQLSAEIAHEIRNSLMSIGGFVQIMGARNQEEGKKMILVEVKRLERFLSSIREYARPALDVCDVDVLELLESVLELMGPELKKHGISHFVSANSKVSRIQTIPDMLRQVIINLIKNSIEAMPEGGVLDIAVSETGDKIIISISDQGSGIEEPQENLFTPLSEGGKSIGLPVSSKLIKDLGGSIGFKSSLSGTTFTLELPRRCPSHGYRPISRSARCRTAPTDPQSDRRCDRRFFVSIPASCIARDTKINARIVNLSKNGILLSISRMVQKIENLSAVEFDVPSVHSSEVNRIKARITPVRKQKKNGTLFLGCRIEPEESTHSHWNKFIRELHLYNTNS